MDDTTTLQRLVIWALPVLSAMTLHEVAHGFMAWRLGDPTAKAAGRLSLNPLRHIDPIGTLLVPLLLFFVSGFVLGWAKPVPVAINRLRHPRRDMMLVALAGPGSNLLMALGWALLIVVALGPLADWPWAATPLYYMGQAGVLINLLLAVLNLLPLPPLDGSKVLLGLLPGRLGTRLLRVEPFGLLILLLLLVTGVLTALLEPPVVWLHRAIFSLLGY